MPTVTKNTDKFILEKMKKKPLPEWALSIHYVFTELPIVRDWH